MSAPTSFSVTLRQVSVSRADKPVLADVDLTFTERSRAALVGPNGVGKSTLLRVIAGRMTPDTGSVRLAPPDATVGLLDQELDRSAAPTVRELVAAKLGIAAAQTELEQASAELAEPDQPDQPVDRYDRALARYLALGAADLDARLDQVADEVGLAPRVLDLDPNALSGGEAERVGLVLVMLSRFDLTLLDEPTNNLDLDGLDRLEDWVATHRGGLVMVSHDRAFLERAVSTVIEIDHHHHTATEFGGGWEAFVTERARAAALAEERYDGYVTERDRLTSRVQRQREWAAKGASRARKHPADGDKYIRNHNIAQTEKLMGKAKATKRAIDRLVEVERPWQPWDLQFTIGEAPRSATIVAAFDDVVLTRGDFVLGPINLEIRWAERIALVGPNGSGKSTLLDAMLGRFEPTSGKVLLGSGVVVGELNQARSVFTGSDTLVAAFQDESGLLVDEARSVLAKFGLDAEACSGRRLRSHRASAHAPSLPSSRPVVSICWFSTNRPITSICRP